MERLHPRNLRAARPGVTLPAYDRDALQPGIVHLGAGAFHRAHQAVYTDDAIANGGGAWGIIGVSLRSVDVARQMNPQAGLYSVLSEDRGDAELRVVGSICQVLALGDGPGAVIDALARQDIRIVTLTITEKGYTLAANGKGLDREDPAVVADLANPEAPSTAVGVLALGLRARVAAGGAPLTLLSCDNLAGNSRLLQAVLADYLGDSFPEVLEWLQRCATFPCSVVDRIVPAMTEAGRATRAERLGLRDEAAVSTEPFSQWIVEDDFAAGRPDWTSAGVQLVHDIRPFEAIKLRLLNASHSAIAYSGLLAGLDTVDAVMADTELRDYVGALMVEELVPALEAPAGFDLAGYAGELLARFSNPCLAHRCEQIAMDGTEKIRQRWVPTLLGGPAPLLRRALAAWCYLVLCTEVPLDDPRRSQLLALRESFETMGVRVRALLGCVQLEPRGTGNFDELALQTEHNLDTIAREGVRALLAH